MATKKSKKTTSKKSSDKPKTTAKVVETKTTVVSSSEVDAKKPFAGFFAKKFDANENILTIFKSPRIYGAIIGEIVGTMLLALVVLTLGIYQPLYIMFAIIGITLAVYGLSGANLNPLITVGMMATRRMSAIRGVVYMLAQVLGAWFAFLIANAFRVAGDEAVDMPVMAEIGEGQFGMVVAVEIIAAIIFAFFFARALSMKRSKFTFAAVVGGGMVVALLFAIVISSNFLSLQNNFMVNPAIALMHQILPTGAENFGELAGTAGQAILAYVIFPMIGGVAGFYLADASAALSGECECCGCDGKDCKCGK